MNTFKSNARLIIVLALGLLGSGFITFFSCRPTKETHVASLQSINWLHGRWTSSQEGEYENFVLIDDNFMERVIYQIEDGQPVISERGKIFEKDASLAMTTTIFDTKQNEFSKYELFDQNYNKVIFRNIQTDDPYFITLELQENGKLDITETNQSGKKVKEYELTRHTLP